MSFFKKLVKGIIIGAVVGFTGGLALLLNGVGMIGATAITLKGAAIYGAIYGGLQGASAAFIKKQRMPTQEVQARSNISVDPQALGKWIFGETAAATDVVYSESVETKQVVHVIAAAAHEIDSYGELYINNNEAVVVGTDVTGEYGGVLKVFRNLGTTTQDALVIDDSLWPSTARGRGQAHYGLRWNFDTDAGKEKLSGGIPTRITQIVKGAKVYDPRLDTTVGGSGAHRADDQTTWEWSDNWALIVANYLLGYRLNSQLIYGVGTDPSEIDWPSVAEMADVCDQVVDGKPRYRIGGIFAITQDHENIIGQLESAIGGKVSKFGGKYYLWCPHNDLISAGTLTDANIIGDGGIQYTPAGPLESLFNTARGQYVEPTLLYQLQPYAEVIESTAVTEDGRERLLQKDFPMIQDASIAQRVSRELIRRSRFSGTITVVVGPIALAVQPFDIVTVNFRETNFTNELFRVISMQYSAGGAVIVELLEEDASIYDTSIALGTSLTQLDPDSYDPTKAFAVVGLTLSNVSVVGAGGTTIDGIKISWTQPPGFVAFTEGGFRKTGDPDFIYDRSERGATTGVVAPVQPGTSYEVRIRHVSIEGVAGAYSTASITTGTTTSIGTAVIADGSITAPKIGTSAVTTDKLDALAVTAAKVAALAIETGKIADLAVATGKLANAAATEAKIATNAITETKISDNAITTPKLIAGAVTAAKITAGTITAAEIAASTITGAKIAAGTITAGNIAALTITATEIAANAITSAKILAGEVIAGKLAANAVIAGNIAANVVVLDSLQSNSSKTFDGSNFMFEMGTSTTIGGYSAAGIFRTAKVTSFAIGGIATSSNSFAIAGQSTNNAGGGFGGAFVNSISAGSGTHITEAFLTNSNQAGLYLHTATGNQVILSNGTYAIDTDGDVNVDGNITATGSITPFTGSHDGVLSNGITPEPGDIMTDVSIIARSGISEALSQMDISQSAGQPAIGVYTGDRSATYLPNCISEHGEPIHVAFNTYIPGPRVLKAEFADLLDDARLIGVNSVGEGLINVCGQNGSIVAGDLIITSGMAGKGMKQDDDIVRSKTVAKARQAVTFASPAEVKLIACIYVCG